MEDPPRWPLSYQLQHPGSRDLYWSHTLYRGRTGEAVEVRYSSNKDDSELLARQFLQEPVVGFDMEWFPYAKDSSRSQLQISLIQVASEGKIALFHIGLHKGEKGKDLIATSLRQLIESPYIIKTGVSIFRADFARLKKYFHIEPRGAFELSNLHCLVTFGASEPEKITTKLVGMAKQVEQHLGLPLAKGNVRRSNWSRALNDEQKFYAADDAYAAFMLYHCMNAKRLAMDPAPPLPVTADTYPDPSGGIVILEPLEEGGQRITATGFFASCKHDSSEETRAGSKPVSTTHEQDITASQSSETRKPRRSMASDPLSEELYRRLVEHRTKLAIAEDIPPIVIATNGSLQALAELYPRNETELQQTMMGIGPKKLRTPEWLEIIKKFFAENNSQRNNIASSGQKRKALSPIPVPNTGLSIQLSQVSIDEDDSSDNDEMFPEFETTPGLSASHLRQKPEALWDITAKQNDPGPVQLTKPEQAAPLSSSSRFLREKLFAFVRRVTYPEHPETLVSEEIIESLVKAQPRTIRELCQVKGGNVIVNKSSASDLAVLKKIIEGTRAAPLVPA